MRIRIEFISGSRIKLPVSYNHILQALIYAHLGEKEAAWLHEHGFTHEKRTFKLFTFSNFIEKGIYNKEEKSLTFPDQVSFYLSSPVDWIVQQLAENFIKAETINLWNNEVRLSTFHILPLPRIDADRAIIKALTPLEVHSTFTTSDDRKKTYYYSPFENDFSMLVNRNMKKKWKSFYNEDCSHELYIKPMFNDRTKNEKVRIFGDRGNGTIIKGWTGKFALKGSSEIIAFAYDTGLGSRNSQGFGMFEVVGEGKHQGEE